MTDRLSTLYQDLLSGSYDCVDRIVLNTYFRMGCVSRTHGLSTTVQNCTRDEGGPFEVGSQVRASNHCKLLSSKAMVVSVAANVGTNPSG